MNRLLIYLIVCSLFAIKSINTKTSILWKLNSNKKIIVGGENEYLETSTATISTDVNKVNNDEIFNIITTTHGSSWIKNCESITEKEFASYNQNKLESQESLSAPYNSTENSRTNNIDNKKTNVAKNTPLNCGKPVNFTYYDYLIGVAQRFNHPLVPEPDVVHLFLKNSKEDRKTFDLNQLEKRLVRARKDKPRSVSIFNQIGNYWRIKGDARQSIECFRRALSISPTNAEVLLNLAGVLFNLQYLDDAIHLTRRSLEVQPPSISAWRQYLTLGEIFKAYGHFQESLLHLRHALDVYPQHDKNAELTILKVIKEVESSPASPLHAYTLMIILILVVAVFIVVLNTPSTNIQNNLSSDFEPKVQRHFNRAMAMKSLKGFTSSSTTRNNFKHRKY